MNTKSNSRSLAKTINELEAARAKLQRELAAVDAALQTVERALHGSAGGRSNGAGRGRASTGSMRRAKSSRRNWFERDEAGALLKKAARRPTTPADLVRELAKIKGYEGRLPKQDMRRFQGAAFMAISQALKTGTLKRQGKNGLLVAG